MSEIMIIDEHYKDPRLVELYDLDSPWSEDREFYVRIAGASPKRILDLGCGTGLLCDAYAAKGHDVTGVDPSSAMLAVARRKPHGSRIEWVQSSAQDYESQKPFDLIVMTGHAFQVLLEDDDVMETLTTIRDHLAPDGTVVFESRNPQIDWASRWNYSLDIHLSDSIVRESRHFIAMNRDRMTFDLRYQFPDGTLASSSELRFLSRQEIENYLQKAGLRIDKMFGDWNQAPFDERSSDEMIFLARRALDADF
jgi:2-polyprenyl-3-methyl-5-hydroxy-6-metoxy-1,4-benzoquinol methylase